MSEKSKIPGEVWTIQPKGGLASGLRPIVLLLENTVSGKWRALPLLDDEDLACNRDVRVSSDFDWLNGVYWCAAKDVFLIEESRFGECLTNLDAVVFGQVRNFIADQECSLPSEIPLVPELGDPRIKARREFLRRFSAGFGVRIRCLAGRVAEAITEFGESLDIQLQGETAGAGFRGESDADSTISLLEEPYLVKAIIHPFESRFALEIESTAKTLSLHCEGDTILLESWDENLWAAPAQGLPMGDYQIRASGDAGESVIDLSLEN